MAGTSKKAGAPKKKVKQEQFEALCAIQCTKEEICSVLGITDKTLDRWCEATYQQHFSVVFREKRAGGKASLRRAQFETAKKGNAPLLIWLGKNWLGQSDNPVQEDASNNNMTALADILQHPAPNRNIKDFEK